MKARLIVHEDAEWVLPSSGNIGPSAEPSLLHPCLWPADRPVPEGWEEIEIAGPFCSPSAAAQDSTTDLCECGARRSHHVGYQHQSLVLGSQCRQFKEVG